MKKNTRNFIVILCILSGIFTFVFFKIFSTHHCIYESNGEYQIHAPKSWNLEKRGVPDIIVSTDGDTIYWVLMRAAAAQWDHLMRYYPVKYQEGELTDTIIDFMDTTNTVKTLIRSIPLYHIETGEVKVCFQTGVYSPGRFNFIYGL